MKSSRLRIIAALIVGLFGVSQLDAQSTLSVQGVLQKTTGMAVEDGDYAITFKLYTTESGGAAVWSETQSDVEIVGGVYGVQLGSVNPLNIPFDQVYYLGLTVGAGAEHFPRTKLTAAPYALSLLGQDNKFPSTGNVGIGTLAPVATLDVNGSIATNETATTATSYTVGDNDHVIYLDHTANQNVTLPAASAANKGRQLLLVNKEAVAKTLTASNYVDLAGATSTTVPATGVVELQSDGSVWRQTGGYVTPVAQAKAFVFAGSNGSINISNGATLPWIEVTDIGNNFSNNTFTAPRTGAYHVSGRLFGPGIAVPSGSWPAVFAMGTHSQANRYITYQYPAIPGASLNLEFNTIIYMVAGQTLFLQIGFQNISTPSGTLSTFNTISHLVIAEQ